MKTRTRIRSLNVYTEREKGPSGERLLCQCLTLDNKRRRLLKLTTTAESALPTRRSMARLHHHRSGELPAGLTLSSERKTRSCREDDDTNKEQKRVLTRLLGYILTLT